MIEPPPINHWSFPPSPRQIARCWQGSCIICSFTNNTIQHLLGQAGSLRIQQQSCYWLHDGEAESSHIKSHYFVFWELCANYNAVNSLMVYIRLACATVKRKCFNTAGGGWWFAWSLFRGFESHVTKGKLWAMLQQGHTLVTVRHSARDLPVTGGKIIESVLPDCLYQIKLPDKNSMKDKIFSAERVNMILLTSGYTIYTLAFPEEESCTRSTTFLMKCYLKRVTKLLR